MDPGSGWDNLTGTYTAPVAGNYEFLLQLVCHSLTVTVATPEFLINNSASGLTSMADATFAGDIPSTFTLDRILHLAAGDFVTFRLPVGSGSQVTFNPVVWWGFRVS